MLKVLFGEFIMDLLSKIIVSVVFILYSIQSCFFVTDSSKKALEIFRKSKDSSEWPYALKNARTVLSSEKHFIDKTHSPINLMNNSVLPVLQIRYSIKNL